MNQTSSQEQEQGLNLSQVVWLIWLGAHIWGLPTELIWRRWFGSRYIDGYLLPAALWPMFFAAWLAPQYDLTWTLVAFWFVILMGAYQALQARWLDRRGFVRHSQYDGYPYLCVIFPLDETRCKMRWEVAAALLLAVLSAVISPSLMFFLLGSCCAVVIKNALREIYQSFLTTDLRDARIEQQSLSRQLNDRW